MLQRHDLTLGYRVVRVISILLHATRLDLLVDEEDSLILDPNSII